MYMLYCDETNFQKKAGDFFVYGGIAIDGSIASKLSDEIRSIRAYFGVPKDFLVKFNPGPNGMPHAKFIELKQAYMSVASGYGVKLLVNLLLHDIATSSDDARRFGINTLCYHFDCFLHRPQVPGVVLIDRFNDKKLDDHLREKIALGFTGPMPFGNQMDIKYIVGYHLASIGTSHFCSLVDVILGSLRFAVNAFTQNNQEQMGSAGAILQQLSPLFFREGNQFIAGSAERVHSISFSFSPVNVKIDAYRKRYIALQEFLAQHGITTTQRM